MAHVASAVLDALPDPCLVIARDGSIRVANKALVQTLGLDRAALHGKPIHALVDDEPQRVEQAIAACFRSSEPTYVAMRLLTGDGAALSFRAEGSRCPADDGEAGPLAFLRLLPRQAAVQRFLALNERIERLNAEIARRRTAERDLAAKIAQLAQAEEQKDRFLALLSHELRNPLAPIRNIIYLLKHARDTGNLKQRLDMMDRHVTHLVRLVDDLLDASRIVSGRIPLRLREIALPEVVEIAAHAMRPRIEEAEQSLEVDLAPGLVVRGDPDRLRQVFVELLDNATKFTPPRGRIFVLAERDTDGVAVRVRDTGPGIAPAIADRLFEFFVRSQPAGQRDEGGLGLGLALAKSIVELHGGTLAVQSEPEAGSEFVVRLPLAADADPSAGHSRQRQHA